MESVRPPEPRPDPARDDPARDEVRVAGGALRCPYCHADVRREEQAWVACAGCMARHHVECWDESSRCGSCGAAERLTPDRGARSLRRLPERSSESLPHSPILGGPARVRLEETFQGEASVADAPWLDSEVRRAVRLRGRMEINRNGVGWRTQECRQVMVQLAASDGQTRLTIEEDLFQPGLALLLGIGLGVGGGVGAALLSQLKGFLSYPLLALSWVGVVLLVTLATRWRLVARRIAGRPAALRALRERLIRGLEAGPWRPPPPTPGRAPDPKLSDPT